MRLMPIVVDATTDPFASVLRIESVVLVIANDVVVALVVVALPVMVKFPATVLDAAFEMKPPNVARPVVSKVEAPMSMLPKPEVMDPELRAPTVVMFDEPAQVESAVFSTLSRARVALRLAVVVPASVPVPEA